jgi:hypothetical protein
MHGMAYGMHACMTHLMIIVRVRMTFNCTRMPAVHNLLVILQKIPEQSRASPSKILHTKDGDLLKNIVFDDVHSSGQNHKIRDLWKLVEPILASQVSICVIPAVFTASFTDSCTVPFVQGVTLLHRHLPLDDGSSRLTLE